MNLKPTATASRLSLVGLMGMTLALSACTVLDGDKIDYKSATKGATLEVPPDLQQLSRDSRYSLPGGVGGVVSANALQANQAAQPAANSTAAAASGAAKPP